MSSLIRHRLRCFIMLSSESFLKSQLATYLWHYRGLESLNGMAAIGCVLRNRVLSGWFGGDWLTVLKDVIEKSGLSSTDFPDFRDPVFTRLIWKIESLFDNSADDITAGAKFWCHLPTVSEEFKKTILQHPEEHPRLANIGGLFFFG
jgi:hypothetical protein